MKKPTMTGNNPCEAHLNIKTGGYCPICMGEELDNLKELNRKMVEALKHINELWNTRPQPGLRDEWDNAIETAGEVLAKAEGEDG